MALEIFKLVGSILVDNEEANKSISKTDEKAEGLAHKFTKGVKTAAKWGVGIVAAAGTAATAMGSVAMAAAGSADEVDKMSQKIGLSNEAYQEWSYIMGQNGMQVDKMQTGMKTLVAQMDSASSGTASAVENFNKLGISIYDASGKLKNQEAIMEETLYALADMENGTEKARLATEMFGKSGIEMMPMLNQGSQAMEHLKGRAHELGLIMSDEAVSAGVTLGDTIDDVKQAFGMLGTQLGSSVVPIIQKFAEMLLQYMPVIQTAVAKLAPVVVTLMDSLMPQLMKVAEQIIPVIFNLLSELLPIFTQIISDILPIIIELLSILLPPVIEIAQALLPALVAALEVLMPLFQSGINLLMPIIQLFIALLVPITTLITQAIGPLIQVVGILISTALQPLSAVMQVVGEIFKSVLGDMFNTASAVIGNIIGIFQGIVSFVQGVFTEGFRGAFQGIAEIVSNIFGGIVEIVKFPINAIIDVINGFIDGLNTIQIPDWVPLVGGAGFNFEHIKKLYNAGNVGSGQLISTNEKEPEIVGNYGARTLVVNNAQIIDTMVNAISQTMEKYIDKMNDMWMNNANGMGATEIIMPFYLGNEMLEEFIVDMKERMVKRSGGRAYV